MRILDVVAGGGVALMVMAGVMLASGVTHAEEVWVDPISISLETSCTLSGTENTPHTVSMVPGTYEDDIGTTTIKAVCNDMNGFALYAIGYTDNTEGKTVMSSPAGSSCDIPTGTATSGDSAWAMKLASVSGSTAPTIATGFDSYHNVPSTYTKVASYSGVTDQTDGSSITTTYAINISSSQGAGTYTGKVRYVMVHPSTTNGYTVTYSPNGGAVSPSSEVVTLGSSTVLPTPTLSGHSFTGWYTAETGGTKVGDAGDSYTPTANTILYAQWEETL